MCLSMSATSAPGERCATYAAVPLAGLVGKDGLPFPLYLRTASLAWVLYKPEGTLLDESHIGRLRAEGVHSLFIEDAHRSVYARRVEAELAAKLGSFDDAFSDYDPPRYSMYEPISSSSSPSSSPSLWMMCASLVRRASSTRALVRSIVDLDSSSSSLRSSRFRSSLNSSSCRMEVKTFFVFVVVVAMVHKR